ncbi:bacillithiol system redox-active protein YtxJ [Flavimarina sp. Hel_I_48]|uniref:bacillithiol system redox-active protein YtxJ n=1 Tax=Flavimarina sp. Hel_I_48 TaxID=1392488 RepID=UPI0004DFB256|nr:bacillithiol system redox-active protein YtxJ [Flavimarina sp. Hel_I_48]
MGFFDKFKSQRDIAKEEIKEVKWIALERKEQVEEIAEISSKTPVLIFKHSTSCGISRMSLKQFEKEYDLEKSVVEPYFLDLKQYREISNLVASKFNVQHESPQVLLIINGEAVYNESHGSISVGAVKGAL